MRTYIYNVMVSVLLLLVLTPQRAFAGGDVSDKTMCFVYVAHSENTVVPAVVEYLDARYQRAMESDDLVLILYLANGTDPIIVKVNTVDDNREDYAVLMKELKERYRHKVDPEYDLKCILGLFEESDFLKPASDNLRYGAVDWHFHVTSDFWEKGYNESLISSLCFVVGTENLRQENFRLRCYFSRYDAMAFDEEHPFGIKNYGNIDFRPYYY